MKDFFWDGAEGDGHTHLVSGKVVTRSKEVRGLELVVFIFK